MNELNEIDILIGECKYKLQKAIDTKDIDLYNTFYTRLEHLLEHRQEVLKIKVIGG